MLRYSFIQFPGVGGKTEEKLWKEGVLSWDIYLQSANPPLGKKQHEKVVEGINSFEEALAKGDMGFLRDHFPKEEIWRTYEDFKDEVAYIALYATAENVDSAEILAIALYDGQSDVPQIFEKDKNLDDFIKALGSFKVLVTFNGVNYDFPLLEKTFTKKALNVITIDLRLPFKTLGFAHSAPLIEKELGELDQDAPEMLEPEEGAGIFAFASEGSKHAQKMLKKTLGEAAKGLKPLMEFAYTRLREEILPHSATNIPQKKQLDPTKPRPSLQAPAATTMQGLSGGTGSKFGNMDVNGNTTDFNRAEPKKRGRRPGSGRSKSSGGAKKSGRSKDVNGNK